MTFPYFGERSPPAVGSLRPVRDAVTLRYSGAGDVTARVHPLRDRDAAAATSGASGAGGSR